MSALDLLQERLGHRFDDPDLLLRALTHTSWAHEFGGTPNERLEFLGDAILQACMTTLLFQRFPDAPEGLLSRYRARMVNTEILAGLGAELDLGTVVRLGRGEDQSGGRRKLSILADATEAVLGALYLDAGFVPCLDAVARWMAPHLDALDDGVARDGDRAWNDPKSHLQEEVQRRWQRTPTYEVVRANGPDHAPTFEVEARVGDEVLGRGEGGSKRDAMREAAADALRALLARDDA